MSFAVLYNEKILEQAMLQLKEIKLVIISALLASMLGGCAPSRPQTTSVTRQAPIYTPQVLENEKQTLPASSQADRTSALPELQQEQQTLPPSPKIGMTPPEESLLIPPLPSDSEKTLETEESKELLADDADMEFIQQRIYEYQYKYDQWVEVSTTRQQEDPALEISPRQAECVQTIERILAGYTLLLDELQGSRTLPAAAIASSSFSSMQQLDIAFLESSCSELLAMEIPPPSFDLPVEEQPELSFDAAQKSIAADVELGNYEDALVNYASLSQKFPGQKPSLATELNYGHALQYTGQLEEAAAQFNRILASDDLSVTPLSLQLEIADLYLASGNIAAAESYYEKLLQTQKSLEAEKTFAVEQLAFLRSLDPDSKDMAAYLQLLQDFQTHDYRIHAANLNEKANRFAAENAGRPIAASGLRLKTFTISQLNAWFDRQLMRIDFLVMERKFAEAADILKNMTKYYLPAELQAVVQKTSYDIAQAELQDTETQRRIKEEELTEQWDTAVHLLDSQKFDDAILAFGAFGDTEYEEQAQLKIIEASNLAAGQLRKDAASLFIKAGKTTDFEKKRDLLVASYELLNEIIVKYPQTDLLDKVNQNIAILEEQIRKFDPALLEELQAENPSPETRGQTPGPMTRQLR
jgi:hypothetical protein